MTLIYDILAANNESFLNLQIESDSKIVVDRYDKKINIPNYILLLVNDIWKLCKGLNVYNC